MARLLSEHGTYDDFRFRAMLREIDREIAETAVRAGTAAEKSVRQAWAAGVDMGRVGVPSGYIYDVSPKLLSSISVVTRDQTTSVWQEAGEKLKGAVRRAALGIEDVGTAIRNLAKTLRSPKVFGNVETRAEMIIRTEVNRTFSMANDASMGEAGKAMEKGGLVLLKYWLTAEDARVRPDHEEAAKRYSKARAIPEDEPYIVGGERLMYPLDPAASPKQTIGCRCVSVPVVKER